MKHKLSKRSTSNKHRHRSYQTQTRRLSISIDHTRTVSPNQINSGTGPAHLDSHTSCLKPNVPLKSQKLLKRDLLRCSNQRPSLLGPQILQPPRIHHGSQQTHSFASSSSSTSSSSNDQRRRSLSVNSRTFHATIDRIGPWPDISISRLHPDGNDLLRPLKTFRNVKNPCLFSPKYYAGLNDNTSKFKFHSSKRTYIEEYRKQKGYLLTLHSMKQPTSSSLSSSRQAQRLDDDQLSTIGTYSGVENYTARERTNTSTTNLSISTREITKSLDDILNNNNNHVPIISSVTNQINIFPSLPIRNNNNNNNNLRSIRHTQHHQTLTLPTLPNASVRYLNSMNPVEKVYADNKKISKENPSKLYFFDGRQNKRISSPISNDSEVTSCSQDHFGFRAPSSSVVTTSERPRITVVYQLPRRTQIIATSNDIESLGYLNTSIKKTKKNIFVSY